MAHVTQQTQRAVEVSVMLKLLWFVQSINPVPAALSFLHPESNCFSVLHKTTLEELGKMNKKMEAKRHIS